MKLLLKFTFLIVAILVVLSFIGVQPLASYKNAIVDSWDGIVANAKSNLNETETETGIKDKVVGFIDVRVTLQEAKQAEKEAQEIERLSKLGICDPANVARELSTNKELEMGFNVVELVNSIRKERGSVELLWDKLLYKCSLAHSETMATTERLFHSDMHEPYAENAWWGGGSNWEAADIVESWMASGRHRTWLLCPRLRHIAVGVAYSNSGTYASWTFWKSEPALSDWWYQDTPNKPPEWWY